MPALVAALALAAAVPARAQAGSDACRNGVISEIFVDNGSVFDVGGDDLDRRFGWAYRSANRIHVRTRESVIRRELLFAVGDCYVPALLEDSERILRSLSFIADADVFGVRQPDGSQHVVVETRDEWSVRLEPQFDSDEGGVAITGLELREDNLLGTGQHVSAYFKESQGERVYGAAVGTRQLLGTRLDAELSVARTPVGVSVVQRLAYPFRGENGRWAFRQEIEHQERNFIIFVPDAGADGGVRRRYFEEERRSFDVGTVMRLGRRGQLTLFGVALAGEWTEYPRDYLSVDGGGDRPAMRQVIPEEPERPVTGLDTISSVRVVFLAGQRNVRFQRRRALDVVRGTEDVRLGVEAEVGIGRSLAAFSDDDDLLVDLGFSVASAPVRGVLAGVSARAEGRRVYGAEELQWRNLFGQADAWAYWRPSDASRHTVVAAATVVGGWRTMVPFQLTMGNRAGLRGLPTHAWPGERRVVASLEHRMYLGWPYPRLFDLGTAVFVDAGKMWAGGDTFGVNSPVEASVGFGLRAAFPPGSRRTYRMDVAVPVTDALSAGNVVVTFGLGQAIGRGRQDDPQLRRSSRRTLSASLFSFPN
ncbi:BamA/TamA family outer membrane protein [Longimicrobium sp.]|uniref:BamA/TamA family outer membrane protein n=1 Tax=Longimicrobium sp. TaxID=2029185 RepID=UPI003B3BDC68